MILIHSELLYLLACTWTVLMLLVEHCLVGQARLASGMATQRKARAFRPAQMHASSRTHTYTESVTMMATHITH